MDLVGGHPYLVRVALYHMAQKRITLEKLLQVAAKETGPYSEHLRHLSSKLRSRPNLATAFKHVITADHPVLLEEIEVAFQLRSLGLVKFQHDDTVVPLCVLYRLYFRHRLTKKWP